MKQSPRIGIGLESLHTDTDISVSVSVYRSKSTKYSCVDCNYTTDFMGLAWEHKLSDHPDSTSQLTQKESENFILNLVVEQTTSLAEDMENLKNDTRNAILEVAKTLETCFKDMKKDNNDKCKFYSQ